jgi:hypothetical protein
MPRFIRESVPALQAGNAILNRMTAEETESGVSKTLFENAQCARTGPPWLAGD